MKKTVIKRRKRVPAAGGVSAGRMTDQAAAEALVAVGRLGGMSASNAEESDGEVEQPKRKRARRGKSEKEKRREREEDAAMEGTEDEAPEPITRGRVDRSTRSSLLRRRRSRESNGSWDTSAMQGIESSGSPPHDRHHQQQMAQTQPQRRSSSTSRDYAAHLQQRTASHQFLNAASPHAHPLGGFDLPPLNAALGSGAGSYGGYAASLMSSGTRDYVGGAPSSYIRSGSNAPSRTHSPLGPAGSGSGSGYVLAAPHHHLGHGYYGQSPLHSHHSNSRSPPPHENGGVPTVAELQRHYDELREQRKKLEDMMEKNERMMVGVKRGLDEMRGASSSAGPSQANGAASNVNGNAAPSVPLQQRDIERPRSRASVWPLEATTRE